MSYSEERLARIERTVEANAQAIAQLTRQNQELLQTIAGTEERIARAEERIARAEERIAGAEERLEAEVKRWDERFSSSAAIPSTSPAMWLPLPPSRLF